MMLISSINPFKLNEVYVKITFHTVLSTRYNALEVFLHHKCPPQGQVPRVTPQCPKLRHMVLPSPQPSQSQPQDMWHYLHQHCGPYGMQLLSSYCMKSSQINDRMVSYHSLRITSTCRLDFLVGPSHQDRVHDAYVGTLSGNMAKKVPPTIYRSAMVLSTPPSFSKSTQHYHHLYWG